jgi:hypothetical protein
MTACAARTLSPCPLAEELKGATLEGALDEAEALWQRTRRGEA